MSRSRNLGIALLSLLSGFLGGLASGHLVPSVFAQEDVVRHRAVEVESLRIVIDGETYAVITAGPEERAPQLFDKEGRLLRPRAGEGRIRLFDSSGRVSWTAPPLARAYPLK